MQHAVGVTEIARLLGVSRARAKQIVQQPGFPAPFERLTGMVIWDRAQVERWAQTNRPQRSDEP